MKKSYVFKDGSWEETEDGTENGPYSIYYKTGELEEIGCYINGEKNGEYKMFYKTGEIEQVGSYKNGEFVGEYKMFYKNGKIKEQGFFENGSLTGILEQYDSRGFLSKQFLILKRKLIYKCISYSQDGNFIFEHAVIEKDPLTFVAGDKITKKNVSEILPATLDYYIYDICGGIYKPQENKYNQDMISASVYLGTYSIRTFMESQTIFFELFKNRIIKEKFKKLEVIKILDIGSGPGAPFVLGIVFALKRHGILKKIECDLVDKNEKFLAIAKNILKKFTFDLKINVHLKEFGLNFSIKDEIENITKNKYNIIICSKMCIEFFNKGKASVLSDLCSYYDKYLDETGIGIINEVTQKIKDTEYFMAKKISEEINNYIKKENNSLKIILPLSCAFRSLICNSGHECFQQNMISFSTSKNSEIIANHCFRIFAHEDFAKNILKEVDHNYTYRMTFYKKQKKNYYCEYSENTIKSGFKNNPEVSKICYNPYKWNEVIEGENIVF